MNRINLLPNGRIEELARRRRIRRWVVAGALCGFIMLCLSGLIVQRIKLLNVELQKASARVAGLKRNADSLEELRQRVDSLSDKNKLISQFDEAPSPTDVLAALSQLAPADLRFREFVITSPPIAQSESGPKVNGSRAATHDRGAAIEVRGEAMSDAAIGEFMRQVTASRRFVSLQLHSTRHIGDNSAILFDFDLSMVVPQASGGIP